MRFFLALAVLGQAFGQPAGFNYDESKAGSYVLPDPLAGVKTAADWKKTRRPEILRLFESQVYGVMLPSRGIRHEVLAIDKNALGGAATRKEVRLWITGKQEGPPFDLLIFVPNKATGKVPAFMGLSFNGNHAVHSDPAIQMGRSGRPRGSESSRWPVELIVERGYALVTAWYGDVFPDRVDGYKDSIGPFLDEKRNAESWNAIGMWAFALSRALDYVQSESGIDATRVAVFGHSRLGKTSLWAGARDDRFAMVISNNSGEGGAALARRDFGETVTRINTSFPHWFCDNFKRYNGKTAELPVDQHMLLSLIAPRPLYVASAQEDLWADPRGEFLSAKAASPVYKLLGTDGLAAADMPPVSQPVMSTIGYHIRPGKHDVTRYDWEQYIAFADKHLRKR